MKTLKVEFGECNYPLFIGSDVVERFAELVGLYRFPDDTAIILEEGSSAQFIPGSDSFVKIKLPGDTRLSSFDALSEFLAAIPWAQVNSGFTLIAAGDRPLLNLASFSCALMSHSPVLVLVPTTFWGMIECGVRFRNSLGWKNRHSAMSVSGWPKMALLDLNSLQNTDEDEIFLLLASLYRNLLLSNPERFIHFESTWQKIGLESGGLIIDALEEICKVRKAILSRGGEEQFLLEDFGIRALKTCEAAKKRPLERREMASLIFLELRWRLKLANELKIGDAEEIGRNLLVIEKVLAAHQVKQKEWDTARDRLLQSLEPEMLNDIHLPKAVGATQKIGEIDRAVGENCLIDC